MLDTRLVQFFLALPTPLKISKGVRRRMIRLAMKDILPYEIRIRDNKTVPAIPTVTYRISKSRDEILSLIKEVEKHPDISRYFDLEKLTSTLQKGAHQQLQPRFIIKAISYFLWRKYTQEKQD
jgi:hypothetical protein